MFLFKPIFKYSLSCGYDITMNAKKTFDSVCKDNLYVLNVNDEGYQYDRKKDP